MHYADESLQTKKLTGNFRSFAWDRAGRGVIVVGDGGRILRVEGEETADLESGTRQNLRGISVNPTDGTALIIGNGGSLLLFDQDAKVSKVNVATSENLRSASWNLKGTLALISGNGGTLLRYADHRTQLIDGARANLRRIAWRPGVNMALATSNCFAEKFIPSPNLFAYAEDTQTLNALNEGRADLIGVDWEPDGTAALVVGYDVIWHNGVIARFDSRNLSPIQFNNKRVYPVAVSWNPTGQLAAIGTATPQPMMAEGVVYLWDQKALKPIFSSHEFFFTAVAWNKEGTELVALGSSASRTFNC